MLSYTSVFVWDDIVVTTYVTYIYHAKEVNKRHSFL